MLKEVTSRRAGFIEGSRVYPLNGRQIDRTRLINTLNYLNFSGKFILVTLRHKVLGDTVTCRAKPSPCVGHTIECRWERLETAFRLGPAYEIQEILIPVGRRLFLVKPHLISLHRNRIVFRVPETGLEVNARKVKRNPCKNIRARLTQNRLVFNGLLVDFSSVSFRLTMTTVPSQTFRWLQPGEPVDITLYDPHEILFSEECRIIRHSKGLKTRIFVVEPRHQQIPRFKKKEFRTLRQTLVPSPDIFFRHPLTGEKSTLKAVDISGSGFSVEEEEDSAVLIPGLFIPGLELSLAGNFKATCKVQVVYRRTLRDAENGQRLKCGLALVDMHPADHRKLLSVLYQAKNGNSYLCSQVDLDRLWRFFFETGFVYPEKYDFFQNHKDTIKQTYKKLYTEHPEIARHFICQQGGHILGHMAMVRFYDSSWLIHHHAARKSDRTRAGLVVLNQIGRFINDSHQLQSLKMNYVFCYYRPENRFPARVFGRSAQNIGNRQGCSLDNFSYFHFRNTSLPDATLAAPWRLAPAGKEDLQALEAFYMEASGGLMLKALELEPDAARLDDLASKFRQCGLKRARSICALKKGNALKAILMLNSANPGLNLSELTNSLTAIVLDAGGLTRDILYRALAIQTAASELAAIPVLLYPDTFTEEAGVPREKCYTLWVLNMQYTDQYFRFIHKLLGRFDNSALPPG